VQRIEPVLVSNLKVELVAIIEGVDEVVAIPTLLYPCLIDMQNRGTLVIHSIDRYAKTEEPSNVTAFPSFTRIP
jgi:hypothetical protein